MMKWTSTLILILISSAAAWAVPEEGSVNRFALEAASWQEPLRLQNNVGNVDSSVANYQGTLFEYEHQHRIKGAGWGLELMAGTGLASGGGTSEAVAYKQGSVNWTTVGVEPRLIYQATDQIDLVAGVLGTYRLVTWPETDTIHVSPSRDLNGVLMMEVDLSVTPHFGIRQGIGFSSTDVGPYWHLGLTYDL